VNEQPIEIYLHVHHVEMAVLLYAIFGLVCAATVVFRACVNGSDDGIPRLFAAAVIVAAFWPVIALSCIWEVFR